jgi:uncharacterized membrane protein
MAVRSRKQESVNPLIQKNIRALLEVRRRADEEMTAGERFADAIARFSGSIPFLVLHGVGVGFWIMANLALVPSVDVWDPYPFVMLAMIASVEAIFLSTFVLITQNRQAALAERRSELDLQVNLLTEHEVTRLLQMMDLLLKKQGIAEPWGDLEDLKQEVAPERVLVEIERELEEDEHQ